MMGQLEYGTIKPLVHRVDQQGSRLSVTFRCPVTGQAAQASASMSRDQRGVGSALRRSLIRNLLRSFRRMIVNLLGRGVAGRIAGDVAREAARGTGNQLQYSRADRQRAIVQAFTTVQGQFAWDSQSNRWVHQSAAHGV